LSVCVFPSVSKTMLTGSPVVIRGRRRGLLVCLGRRLLVTAVSRARLLVAAISGALGWMGLLEAVILVWIVTGVLLLWWRGVSTRVVARTRVSRHIQTDSRQ
jgi:hypothetical protein